MPFDVPLLPRIYESVARMLCTLKPMPPAYLLMHAHLRETTRSEAAQISTRDHSHGSEMETIHEDGVRTLRHGPRGGSFVIFTETCMTATGKCGDGFEVNHSRNDSCT